jgi:hypothetical protein
MFWKALITFIGAHLLFLSGSATKIYVAPKVASSTPQVKTVAQTTTIASSPQKQIASTTQKVAKPIAKIKEVKPQVPKATSFPTPKQTPIAPEEPTFDFEAINTFTRQSIVNILCTTKYGDLSPISGTGIVVKSDGLILTNAHIGQYLLIKDFREKDYISCVARVGSPAYPKYKLKLVYISPNWVADNKTLLKEQNPLGTGENDYAFLKIESAMDGSEVKNIPFMPININENIPLNSPVLLASYPAGFLGGISILQDLNVTSAITSIQNLFTFKDGTIDVISVPGTVVSQKGSSGGAVVDKHAMLIGVISTSSNGSETKDRNLNAITMAYVNRDIQKELGISLADFLTQDEENFAKVFASTSSPTLSKLIIDELNKI